MTADAWHSVGFSGLPSDASPGMQDEAARRLYARYGTAPWPVCGKRYGGSASGGATSATSGGWASFAGTTSSHAHPATAAPSYRKPSHRVPSVSTAENWAASRQHAAKPGRHTSAWTDPPVLDIRLVGQTRADVWFYQVGLRRLGFHLVADGRFGPVTALTTKHFQAAHGLLVDGRVGPQTRAALLRAL